MTTESFSAGNRSSTRRASSSPTWGVSSDILSMARFPAASADVSGPTARLTGKLNGTMIPMQPLGWGMIWFAAGRNQMPVVRRRGFIHLPTLRRAKRTVCSVVAISAISVS